MHTLALQVAVETEKQHVGLRPSNDLQSLIHAVLTVETACQCKCTLSAFVVCSHFAFSPVASK